MKYDIQSRMYRFSIIMEVFVGIIVTIAIAIATAGLVLDTSHLDMMQSENLLNYLESTMGIIIGIEFIKLIFSHTMDAAIEVMLLAIVRQMIIEHTSPKENLFAVIAVVLLFVIRKYLFVRKLDHMPTQTNSLLGALLHPERDTDHSDDNREEDSAKLEKREKELLQALHKIRAKRESKAEEAHETPTPEHEHV